MITFRLAVDDKELRQTLGRVKANFPGFSEQCIRGLADRTVNRFKKETKNRRHYNSGYLYRSFRRVKLGKNQYSVVAAGRLNVLENGSIGHPIPQTANAILWARKHGMSFRRMKSIIAKKGTQAHPYTEETLMKLRSEYTKFLRNKFDRYLQSKGKDN